MTYIGSDFVRSVFLLAFCICRLLRGALFVLLLLCKDRPLFLLLLLLQQTYLGCLDFVEAVLLLALQLIYQWLLVAKKASWYGVELVLDIFEVLVAAGDLSLIGHYLATEQIDVLDGRELRVVVEERVALSWSLGEGRPGCRGRALWSGGIIRRGLLLGGLGISRARLALEELHGRAASLRSGVAARVEGVNSVQCSDFNSLVVA